MKWIGYSLAIVVLASATLAASSAVTTEQTEPAPAEDDFIPTEKVPADSAISFPVDI